MAMLTQGTQIFALVPPSTGTGKNTVMEIEGVTAFNPGGNPADQIDTTTLKDQDRTFEKGLRTPGSASMTIQADATKASHVRLHELSQAAGKNTVRWVVGFSDGPKDDKGAPTAVPTANTDGTDFVLPTTRTWFIFDGYVSDFPFDFATNSVVSTAATVQRTGGSTWQRKST
ncbi:phage tail tube protein [Pseudomonas oryzihabitans]|uniref:Phage tail tube, TTP, lambda-like n=1 Tax=Pseudomonas oryzihabitans TaxID=47885 RepID=A0A1G5MW66_9PSED|nr:phage tail tube protein [Pseudomonas psychrotolerans]NMY89826.1 phage tail protein [Pseudomonas psychrotolerans]SCZ28809.1 Phage tail tube, TTP, lambda-like [Pseudomonas psychrotolerans]